MKSEKIEVKKYFDVNVDNFEDMLDKIKSLKSYKKKIESVEKVIMSIENTDGRGGWLVLIYKVIELLPEPAKTQKINILFEKHKDNRLYVQAMINIIKLLPEPAKESRMEEMLYICKRHGYCEYVRGIAKLLSGPKGRVYENYDGNENSLGLGSMLFR